MTFFYLGSTSISRKNFYNSIVAIGLLVFIAYGASLKNGFAMDDEYVSLKNKQVQKGVSAIPDILTSTYVNDEKQKYEYRPLVKVSYAIEYSLFNGNVKVSHFINILLYYLLCVLLFYLLLRLFPDYHFGFSLLITVFFVLHPLHSEVVISLKNRDGLLSFLFSTLAILSSLSYVERKKIIYVFISSIFLFLALLSKKDALTFYATIPFVLWFFRDVKFKKVMLVYIVLVSLYFLFFALESSINTEPSRKILFWENPLFLDSVFWERIPQGIYTLWFYLKMFCWPIPLVSYYGYDQIAIIDYMSIAFWLLILPTLVGGYFLFIGIKEKKAWAFGIVFFIISISMFTNVVQPVVGIVGERFAFIASFGLCISLAVLVIFVFKINIKNTTLPLINLFHSNSIWIILILLVFWGGLSFSRNKDWKDALTLYEADVIHAPESAHTHSLYAAACIQRVRETPGISNNEKRKYVDLAIKHYLKSIDIYPDYATSLNNVGMVYQSFLGAPLKALPHLEKAIQIDSNYVEAYYNLATCNAYLKKYQLAERYYLKAIELNPEFLPAYQSATQMFNFLKQEEKILEFNKKGIEKGVKSDVFYINIANVYVLKGDTLSALPFLEKAIELVPNNKGVNLFLSKYYGRKGETKKADFHYKLINSFSN